MLAEKLLARLCKDPSEVPYDDPLDPDKVAKRQVPAEPLANLEREFPDLERFVRGKDVLDFGCGFGDQSGELARKYAARVVGLDSHPGYLAAARARYPAVTFTNQLHEETFDVIVSQDAMEHFDDPQGALALMRNVLRPGAKVLMHFGPPWYAPYGAHANFFCPVPWLQLWFSEKTVLTVRRRYRQDGARRYEEVEGGLNQMSLAKFERIVKNSGLEVERLKYTGVKQLHFLTKIPGIREFMTNVVTVVLRAPA
jgi:SAM-dependent methyltransferase